MTIRETMTKLLMYNGLSPSEADTVMESMISDKSQEPMADRWDEASEGHDKHTLAVLWACAKHFAIVWIDANAPEHWARAMFTQE